MTGSDRILLKPSTTFYDALVANDSTVKVLGDETLRRIAQELVRTVRANVAVDWTLRESARAHLRVMVKRVLRRYGYPPDKQEKAAQTVLEQAQGKRQTVTTWPGDLPLAIISSRVMQGRLSSDDQYRTTRRVAGTGYSLFGQRADCGGVV